MAESNISDRDSRIDILAFSCKCVEHLQEIIAWTLKNETCTQTELQKYLPSFSSKIKFLHELSNVSDRILFA